MQVTIRFRIRQTATVQELTVRPSEEVYARALALAGGGRLVDCTVAEIPAGARIGEDQDAAAYTSPVYPQVPSVLELVDDEEHRRRNVEQAERVVRHVAMIQEEEDARARRDRRRPLRITLLGLVAAVIAATGCASGPAPAACFGPTVCVLQELELAAAAEGLEAAALLGGGAGYVIHSGDVIVYDLPSPDPGPVPPNAVALYDGDAGEVVPICPL